MKETIDNSNVGLVNNYDEIRRNVQDAFDRTNELLDRAAKEHR